MNSEIKWQSEFNTNSTHWTYGCDFKDNDLNNKQTIKDDCGTTCISTTSCTHFVWTSFNNGTCWMKSGNVSRYDAVYTGDLEMICGFLSSI
jgi:hypothetical protein